MKTVRNGVKYDPALFLISNRISLKPLHLPLNLHILIILIY